MLPAKRHGWPCPKLEGFGIGHHLLLLQFPDVLAGKLGVRWWQETLLMKAQWCQWGLIVILNMVPFADLPWEFERGLHLPCQFLIVIHPRNLSQFLPLAGHVMHLGSPVTQLSNSSTGGSGEDILPSSSPKLSAGPWRKQSTSGPNSGRASKSKSRRASSSSSDSRPLQGGDIQSKGHGSPLAASGGTSSSIP